MVFMFKITGTYLARTEQTRCIFMRGVTKTDIPQQCSQSKQACHSLETISLLCSDSSRLLGANYLLQYTGIRYLSGLGGVGTMC